MRHADKAQIRTSWRAMAVLAGLALAAGCANDASLEASEPQDITINGSRVFPESVTSDAAGNLYNSSVSGIIYRATKGSPTAEPWISPTAENGLTSLFGVLADDANGRLWACNNAPFGGPARPDTVSSLKAFDLATGALQASYDFPRGPAACNDIAIAADGTVYATETAGGRIFALPTDANALTLFASGQDLVGVDGIAFADDGAMYINNVRSNQVQRVKRKTDGAYDGLTNLTLSEPVSGPDGLRPVSGNRFLQAEGSGNRVTYVDIDGDNAKITVLKTGLESSPGVTFVGDVGYVTEGKIAYMMDPELRDKDPGTFMIRAFKLAEQP